MGQLLPFPPLILYLETRQSCAIGLTVLSDHTGGTRGDNRLPESVS